MPRHSDLCQPRHFLGQLQLLVHQGMSEVAVSGTIRM